MANKRQATTELNDRNWDQDDPEEHEEMGTYQKASKAEIEKRVIRTAKRRSVTPISEEPQKSLFSGFGGFNKPPPSSFDFLANLTNGVKTNGSSKVEDTASNKLGSGSNGGGLFNIPTSTNAPLASGTQFKLPATTATPVFGISSSPTNNTNIFSTAKTSQNSNEVPANTFSQATGGFTFKSNSNTSMTSSTSSTSSKPPFESSNTNLFAKTTSQQSVPSATSIDTGKDETKVKNESEAKKLVYYGKLKALNECVSDWIKKHVSETPLCILTPIFRDYENHLKTIQADYQGAEEKEDKTLSTKSSTSVTTESSVSAKTSTSTISSSNKPNSNTGSFFTQNTTSPTTETKQPSLFSLSNKANINTTSLFTQNQSNSATETKQSGPFSFGIKPETPATNNIGFGVNQVSPTKKENTSGILSGSFTENKTFSFGINKTPNSTEKPSGNFLFSTNTSGGNTQSSTPFSFGTNSKFSFSPNTNASEIKKDSTAEEKNETEDDDAPPKVEFTPVVEENSVFEKRCKIFVKKDKDFIDKGIGTLFVKKINETGKHQLLVRANTNLGNILLNFLLSSSIPTQRMGKNNVMMVCIPTPDSKPPPTPVLVRVKTSEEADELLETLNKYKA